MSLNLGHCCIDPADVGLLVLSTVSRNDILTAYMKHCYYGVEEVSPYPKPVIFTFFLEVLDQLLSVPFGVLDTNISTN